MTVGRRVRPLDWAARSGGTLAFTADLRGEHLHAAVLRSPHPHAQILSVDVRPALRCPGVHAVLTAQDFPPGITYLHRGAPLSDRPPLAAGVVRHVGQEVAAVAAESREQARAACRAIRVRYRLRRAPLTVAEARAPGAPRLHDRTSGEPNVSVLLEGEWGDVASGLAGAIVSVSGSFVYPSVAHAVMEPNTTLASWRDGRVELWTSTQAPWFVQKEVSHLLGIAHDDVVVREVAVGGGFGSKSKISEHEVLAAALSRKAGRPVLLEQSREDEFAYNKPRHRFETTLTTHADRSGVIRALEADIAVDNGSHNHMGSSVMRVGLFTLGSMYRPDGVRFAARLVDTATQPGGQFRGYGTPQVSLAMESQLDEIAERLAVDPLELRLRNLAAENTTSLCGYRIGTTRLGDCLLAVRDAVGWERQRTQRPAGRGVGVAAGSHGSGAYAYPLANRSDAAVDLFEDGHVRVRHGGADAGTGQNTILAQIAATELGVAVDAVEVLSMDSDRTPFELGAWSSRGTHMTGSSVGQAARELARDVLALGAEKLGTDEVALRDGAVVSLGSGGTEAIGLGDLVRLSPRTVDGIWSHESSYLLSGTEPLAAGVGTANLSPSYAFAAHAAVVDVDRRTGRVSLVDYVAAHDVGRAVNPTLVEGQIVGGVVMGLGGALGEETIRCEGRVVNSSYLHYAMPRAADVPVIRPIVVEGSEPAGPYGAKAVGEMSIIPPGAAVANAVYDAVGVRIRSLPITPDKVLSALADKEGRRRTLRLWRRPGTWWVTAVRAMYPHGLHALLHRYGTRFGRGAGPSGAAAPPRVLVPERLDEALAAVGSGATPIGGASDHLVERGREPRPAPVLVALTQVQELRGIRVDEDGTCASARPPRWPSWPTPASRCWPPRWRPSPRRRSATPRRWAGTSSRRSGAGSSATASPATNATGPRPRATRCRATTASTTRRSARTGARPSPRPTSPPCCWGSTPSSCSRGDRLAGACRSASSTPGRGRRACGRGRSSPRSSYPPRPCGGRRASRSSRSTPATSRRRPCCSPCGATPRVRGPTSGSSWGRWRRRRSGCAGRRRRSPGASRRRARCARRSTVSSTGSPIRCRATSGSSTPPPGSWSTPSTRCSPPGTSRRTREISVPYLVRDSV